MDVDVVCYKTYIVIGTKESKWPKNKQIELNFFYSWVMIPQCIGVSEIVVSELNFMCNAPIIIIIIIIHL